MTELNKAEYARLESQVDAIEKVLASGRHGDAGSLLGAFLAGARGRMSEIKESALHPESNRKERDDQSAVAVAAMVEREHRLTVAEKRQYGEFMILDFFTEENFAELDHFYATAWDRLSEDGKAQMSQRVWEGIRQGEYSFADLPENVRKKEADRLYEQLADASRVHGALANIPEQDRADFIRAHESGDKKVEAEILSRESFSMNVSTTSSTEDSLRDPSVSSKKEVEGQKAPEIESKRETRESGEGVFGGFTLAEASEVTRPDLPTQPNGSGLQRS